MVFILALGYYITPALVGGGADQMLSYFVATYTTDTGNWGLARRPRAPDARHDDLALCASAPALGRTHVGRGVATQR
jgi:hypothetical protein